MSRELGIAIDRLRDYPARVIALNTIPQQIAAVEAQLTSIRSATTDGEPVSGGSNKREDMVIANILRRDRLQAGLEVAKWEVAAVEAALAALTEEEQRILDLFYMHRTKDYIARLCDELCLERSRVYELKSDALRKFALAMCGTVDL